MHPFHERLARVGLTAVSEYGFALAGGYAVQAHGLLVRPSEDIDLFTAATPKPTSPLPSQPRSRPTDTTDST